MTCNHYESDVSARAPWPGKHQETVDIGTALVIQYSSNLCTIPSVIFRMLMYIQATVQDAQQKALILELLLTAVTRAGLHTVVCNSVHVQLNKILYT